MLGEITDVEVVAVGSAIREIARLRRFYGAMAQAQRSRLSTDLGWYHSPSRGAWVRSPGNREEGDQDGTSYWQVSMDTTLTEPRFAVCIKNDGYAASLKPRKVYRLVTDGKAALHGLVRSVDESGEDYLYPADYFAAIELPRDLALALARVA